MKNTMIASLVILLNCYVFCQAGGPHRESNYDEVIRGCKQKLQIRPNDPYQLNLLCDMYTMKGLSYMVAKNKPDSAALTFEDLRDYLVARAWHDSLGTNSLDDSVRLQEVYHWLADAYRANQDYIQALSAYESELSFAHIPSMLKLDSTAIETKILVCKRVLRDILHYTPLLTTEDKHPLSSSQCVYLYRHKDLKRMSYGARVWIREQSLRSDSSTWMQMDVDWKQNKIRMLRHIGYDEQEKVIYDNTVRQAEWEDVVPNSIGEGWIECISKLMNGESK